MSIKSQNLYYKKTKPQIIFSNKIKLQADLVSSNVPYLFEFLSLIFNQKIFKFFNFKYFKKFSFEMKKVI
jgi:hypothetical protein